MSKELDNLLAQRSYNLSDWLIGKIPKHYKRLSIPQDKALQYAIDGASTISAYFGVDLFFTQSLIAGVIFSGDFDKITIVTPSQYGKSFLLGHIGVLQAYRGRPVYIAASSGEGTRVIMNYAIKAVQNACPEIQQTLQNKQDSLERLATSVSKTRLAFHTGGFLEAMTLSDTYKDNLAKNKAVGRAGDTFVDEAALISESSLAELGRREFASVSNDSYQMVQISNPHKPGLFYDSLVAETTERSAVIWLDVLTSIEEERWEEERVRESEFDKHKDTRKRYLLCELDIDGDTMFATPKLYQAPYRGDYTQWFLGIDAAYRGKDNVCIALTALGDDGIMRVEEIIKVDKGEWIDGVTSEEIINFIAKINSRIPISMMCGDIGFGVWLIEGLAKRGLPILGINFGAGATKERIRAKHYASVNAFNMRAEMHLDMQDLIENDRILFSEDAFNQIKDTLPYVISERKTGGRIAVRPKSEIKAQLGRSPDELDAVLLSIHAGVVFSGEGTFTS